MPERAARLRAHLTSVAALAIAFAALGYTPLARGSPADVLAVLALILALFDAELRAALPRRAFVVPAAAIGLVLAIGVARSPVPALALPAATKLGVWLLFGRLVYLLAAVPATGRLLAASVVLPAAGTALVGVGAAGLGLLGVGGLPGTAHHARFPLGFAATRFVGFFPTANDQALAFALALLAIPLLVPPPRLRRRAALAALMAAGCLATLSRMLVTAVLAALAVLWRHASGRARRWGLAAVVSGQLGVALVTAVAFTRTALVVSPWIARPQAFAEVHGVYLWRMGYFELKAAALQLAWEHPLLGVGLRGFGPSLPRVVDPEIATRLPRVGATPHSTYGFVLAELGALGFVVFLLAGAQLLRVVSRRRRQGGRRTDAGGALEDGAAPWWGLVAALLLVALDYEVQHHRLVYVAVGLLGAYAAWPPPGAQDAPPPGVQDAPPPGAQDAPPPGARR